MTYVNGALIAVPTANKQKYLDMATEMAQFFRSKGALRCVECWGSDVADGKLTSMPMAVQKEDDETVVFAWIEWPDKETADTAMAEMMSGGPPMAEMPFDGQRMIFGGFEKILNA